MKGQSAIVQFVEIGTAALGELHRLAATAPAENSTGENPTADAYPATMAAIIIRRIETAQRQPILEELISLDEAAHAVLSLKLDENEAAATAAECAVEAATAALIKASANTTIDAPAVGRGARSAGGGAGGGEAGPGAPRHADGAQAPDGAQAARAAARFAGGAAAAGYTAGEHTADPTDFAADRFVLVLRYAGTMALQRQLGLAAGQRRMASAATVHLRSAGHHVRAAELRTDAAATQALIAWLSISNGRYG